MAEETNGLVQGECEQLVQLIRLCQRHSLLDVQHNVDVLVQQHLLVQRLSL